jgi:hypothetical protein
MNEAAVLPFNEALQHALDKCEVATKTKACYRSTVKYISKAATALAYDKVDISNKVSEDLSKLPMLYIG